MRSENDLELNAFVDGELSPDQQAELLERVRDMLPAPLDQHALSAQRKERQLMLYCDSPAWASRLRFHSRELRNNLLADGVALDKVTVRVTPQSVPRRHRAPPVRRLSRKNSDLLLQVAEGIDDPALRDALQRLGRHHR